MDTKTIGASKTFNPHQFHFDKISLEDSFPKSVSDIECIKQLHERIDAMAKEVYPWLFEIPVRKSIFDAAPLGNHFRYDEPIQEEQKPLLDLINESQTIKALEGWRLLITLEKDEWKKKMLSKAYDAKKEELQKQPA